MRQKPNYALKITRFCTRSHNRIILKGLTNKAFVVVLT